MGDLKHFWYLIVYKEIGRGVSHAIIAFCTLIKKGGMTQGKDVTSRAHVVFLNTQLAV